MSVHIYRCYADRTSNEKYPLPWTTSATLRINVALSSKYFLPIRSKDSRSRIPVGVKSKPGHCLWLTECAYGGSDLHSLMILQYFFNSLLEDVSSFCWNKNEFWKSSKDVSVQIESDIKFEIDYCHTSAENILRHTRPHFVQAMPYSLTI